MDFLNTSQAIGQIMDVGSKTLTGDMYVTILIILAVLIAMAMMFGIAFEYTAVLIVPILLGCMSYYSELVGFGMALFIYLALVFVKVFIFR